MMERLAKLERQLRMQRKNMRKLCTMNQLGRSKFKFPKNAKGQNRTRTRGHRGRKKNHPAAAKKDPSATADLSSSNGSSIVKEGCQRHTDCKPGNYYIVQLETYYEKRREDKKKGISTTFILFLLLTSQVTDI
jgi:hypothetical protein